MKYPTVAFLVAEICPWTPHTCKAVMLHAVPHCSVICDSPKAVSIVMFNEQLQGNETVAELLWGK